MNEKTVNFQFLTMSLFEFVFRVIVSPRIDSGVRCQTWDSHKIIGWKTNFSLRLDEHLYLKHREKSLTAQYYHNS